MTSKDIQKLLIQKFNSHKYILLNSYVFDWESDFFSRTPSKYFIELEIKISLTDFKKDFTKTNKHTVIERKYKGEKTFIKPTDNTYEYSYTEENNIVVNGKRQFDEQGTLLKTAKTINKTEEIRKIDFYKNYYKDFKYTQISSGIEITELPKTPNKLYYICPENIIPIDMIPSYAGLYYVTKTGRIIEKKKAPFIHKEILNLDGELLQKFYWKSVGLNYLKI